MSDFTKDELERIYISVHVANIMREFHFAEQLKEKIQSMIDNYDKPSELLTYISNKVIETHKTCLTDLYDNGRFQAYKDIQQKILKGFDNE